MADKREGQNGDSVRRLKHTKGRENPHTHRGTRREPSEKSKTKPANLRVDGDHFGIAEVIRTVNVMVAVTKRHVAVLFVQWAQDVELLVDHLQEGGGSRV